MSSEQQQQQKAGVGIDAEKAAAAMLAHSSRTRSISHLSAHSHHSASVHGSPPFTPASVSLPKASQAAVAAESHSRSRASSRQQSSQASPLAAAGSARLRPLPVTDQMALPAAVQTFSPSPASPLTEAFFNQKSSVNGSSPQHQAQAGIVAGEPAAAAAMAAATQGYYNGEPLNPDANLYVANLPGTYSDQDLHNFFAKYGEIVRYAVKSTGNPRAYGFVQFKTEDEAKKAIEDTNGMDVKSGQPLSVSIALQHKNKPHPDAPPTNLYIRGLPPEFRKGDLDDLFAPHGTIVQSRVVDIGVGFVRYDTNRSALDAIDKLNGTKPPNALDDSERLLVKFANPSPARSRRRSRVSKFGDPLPGVAFGQPTPGVGAHFPLTADNSQNLYCRGLPGDLTKVQLETMFGKIGSLTSTKLIGNGVAFVRYDHPVHAEQAIRDLNGVVIRKGGEPLLVKLANSDPAKTHPNFMSSLATSQPPSSFRGVDLPDQQEVDAAQRSRRLSYQQQGGGVGAPASSLQSASRRMSRSHSHHHRRLSASQRHHSHATPPPHAGYGGHPHHVPYSHMAGSPMYTHPALAQHHALQPGWISSSPMASPTAIHPSYPRFFDSPPVAHAHPSAYGAATPHAHTPTLSTPQMPNAATVDQQQTPSPQQQQQQTGGAAGTGADTPQQPRAVPPALAHIQHQQMPFNAPSPQSPHPSLPLPFYAPLSWKHGYGHSPRVYAHTPPVAYPYQVPYHSATPQPVSSPHAAAAAASHQYLAGRHSAAPHYQHLRSHTPVAVTPVSSPPPQAIAAGGVAPPPTPATPGLPQVLMQHRAPPAETAAAMTPPPNAAAIGGVQQQHAPQGVVQPHPVYASQTVSAEDLLVNQLSNLSMGFDGATAQGDNSAGQGTVSPA